MAKQEDEVQFADIKLPAPLHKEEEQQLMLNFYENTDIFVNRNLRLVAYIVKKFATNKTDFDDFFSVGTIGLMKAVNTFNPEKKIKFATYAVRCIENEILMYMRASKKHNNVTSLDEIIHTDYDGNELTYQDVIKDEKSSDFQETFLNHDLASDLLDIALNRLTYKEQVVLLYKLAGKKQKSIGKLMGLSQSYISRLEKSTHKKIKRFFKEQDKVGINFEKRISFLVRGDIIIITFYTDFYSPCLKTVLLEKHEKYQYELLFGNDNTIRVIMDNNQNNSFQILAEIIIALHDHL